MTTDPSPADAQPPADAWLDGLAGRDANGADAADGRRLRQALLPAAAASVRPVPWSEIQRLATLDPPAAQAAVQHPPATAVAAQAANDSQWSPAWTWAAVLVLGAAVLVAWEPWRAEPPDGAMRGMGSADAAARWHVAEPEAAAAALATELRVLGAQVELASQGNAVLLSIDASAGVRAAVNQRLLALETALDSQGRLRLRVMAP